MFLNILRNHIILTLVLASWPGGIDLHENWIPYLLLENFKKSCSMCIFGGRAPIWAINLQ